MMNIYLASSWRNPHYESLLEELRKTFCVYDFKERGFEWHEVISANSRERKTKPSHKWKVDGHELKDALKHPTSLKHYSFDAEALKACNALVLLLPCGRSAHLEAGFAMGERKPVFVYLPPTVTVEPELMYLLGGSAEEVYSDFSSLKLALESEREYIKKRTLVFR